MTPALFVLLWFAILKRWEEIPPGVASRERLHFGRLRPSHLWIAFLCSDITSRVANWYHLPSLERAADGIGAVILVLLLPAHLIWAVRIVRRRWSVDAYLYRFARYVMVTTAIGMIVVGWSLYRLCWAN